MNKIKSQRIWTPHDINELRRLVRAGLPHVK